VLSEVSGPPKNNFDLGQVSDEAEHMNMSLKKAYLQGLLAESVVDREAVGNLEPLILEHIRNRSETLSKRLQAFALGEDREFLSAMLMQVAFAAAIPAVDMVCCVVAACESPIEQVFIGTLWSIAPGVLSEWISDLEMAAVLPGGQTFGNPFAYKSLTIEVQPKVGKFRADFRITYTQCVPDFDNRDAQGIPGSKAGKTDVIVECDGHDFHDRTKKQVARDKARDRAMVSGGDKVFRFSGSEIWKDPVQCADETLRFLVMSGGDFD
jgi:hypothetical protein